MDWTAQIAVHESASPEFLRHAIISASRAGRVHPHLLYSGLRQTSLWIALHRTFSPARNDASCRTIYGEAFQRVSENLKGNVAHVVSLACGDGSKDLACLQAVRASTRTAIYTPVDISVEMVLSALRETSSSLRGLQSTPLVCDLARCSVLPAILKGFDPAGAERIILFLGTIHNYWPPDILRSILYPLRSQDQLLISANLAPAADYERRLEKILPQYDNEPTRRWLWGALSELGLNESDGELSFTLVSADAFPGLKRIEAAFVFKRDKEMLLPGEQVGCFAGTKLVVFFSYRFTLQHMHAILGQAGLVLRQEWVDASGEEGLFLCQRGP